MPTPSSPDTRPRADADRRGRPQDDTRVSSERDGPSPRLPHEHDQSADSVSQVPQPRVEQAGKDLERGLVDTDRGPPMDQAYDKQKR